jgi:hypothetical protein
LNHLQILLSILPPQNLIQWQNSLALITISSLVQRCCWRLAGSVVWGTPSIILSVPWDSRWFICHIIKYLLWKVRARDSNCGKILWSAIIREISRAPFHDLADVWSNAGDAWTWWR